MSGSQAEGVSFLYRGIPRSMLMLMAIFLVVYAAYWVAALTGAHEVGELLMHALGLLVGIVLAISLMRLWPRLEAAVPRWFRGEVDGPALHKRHMYLAWIGALVIVAMCALFVIELTLGTIMLMGLVGGFYILVRLEARIIDTLVGVRHRLPWLWRGSGWRVFLVLFAMLTILVIVVSAVGAWVGSNEDPVTHEVKAVPTLLVIIPSIALVIHAFVMIAFVLVQAWRAWMARRERRGKSYGPYRTALLRTHPASLACYLVGVNYATGAFVFAYTLMLVLQAIAEARSQGLEVGIDLSGFFSGQALDYLALLSFAVAWIALLLSLSGTAVREERWFFNRRVFASLSVFFLMVLFIHVIAARGDEFTISVAFRAMYLLGIALAPLLVTWRRWRTMVRMERGKIDRAD